MEKEIIKKKSFSVTVDIVANRVNSLRKITETTSTVRVYSEGFIGVAGQVGETDLAVLEAQAVKNLENKLPYPCLLSENQVGSVDARKQIIDVDKILDISRSLMLRLREAVPDFAASNKIQYFENETEYSNSKGTSLSYKGNELAVVLTFKHKDTANIMDFYYVYDDNEYNEDKVVDDIKLLCDKFLMPASIEKGKYKIIAMPEFFIANALTNFTGDMYASNASIFKNRLNEKIFDDKVSILFNKSLSKVNISFFDDEGETAENHISYLVKNGVFTSVIANKKTAAEYKLPRTATSEASYDGIPSFGFSGLEFSSTAADIYELIGDEKAIFVVVASGGDITSGGDFATPVQVSFLVENGRITGKLPPLNVHGNIEDYLGVSFVGATKKAFFSSEKDLRVVAEMSVEQM